MAWRREACRTKTSLEEGGLDRLIVADNGRFGMGGFAIIIWNFKSYI